MKLERESLQQQLEPYFFNSWTIAEVVDFILGLEPRWQRFVLDWVLSLAKTEPEIGYQFASQAGTALQTIGREGCEAWLQSALDIYFERGLQPALLALKNLEQFVADQRKRSRGLEFARIGGLMQHFLHGLNGRRLTLESSHSIYTDSETLRLPTVIDQFGSTQENFTCFKAIAVHQWAQCWYGTWRADALADIPREEPMLRTFHFLETLRLNACIARDYPGLARQLNSLQPEIPQIWRQIEAELSKPTSSVFDSIRLSAEHWDKPRPDPFVYQGRLDPERVQQKVETRLEREKQQLRAALTRLAEEQRIEAPDDPATTDTQAQRERNFDFRHGPDSKPGFEFEGIPMPADEEVDSLVTSILQDLGEIPPDYLQAAASSGYHDDLQAQSGQDQPEDAGIARYQEKGAFLYDEWDCTRKAHRKRWCTVRERGIQPDYDSSFVADTLQKYRGHIKSLRRSFEALRDEYRILKKQPHGENLDFDALVEAIADVRSGMEMTSRIYRKAHRVERNIAVILMVDMSGSTKGWINTAQREALILLAEALSSLDDRYAIYGFSGNTRKRCEIYRIKTFDEVYDEKTRARIAAIEPQDYTRMGATIRHLSHLLDNVRARTKLLVTLSDGKPDDYDTYHGEYGIEDTRMALFEARRRGIHPFCITIDEEAREYLPHMYGDSAYVLIDDIDKLPFRISEIYRSLTT
ncbi:MAG: nitric oxide reductase activation protein [Gammaproteobacteria bacterium]|nr:MAG: nitric oxide reductase activation protein [Gammaproteobacteria bacterium]